MHMLMRCRDKKKKNVGNFYDQKKEFEIIMDTIDCDLPQDVSCKIRAKNMQRNSPESFYTFLAAAVIECRKKCSPSLRHQCSEISRLLGEANKRINKNSLDELVALEKVNEIADEIFEIHDFTLAD